MFKRTVITLLICSILAACFAFTASADEMYFSDVPASKYYYESVMELARLGIVKGYSDGTFRPNKTCTRKDALTFLWRYAGCPEISGEPQSTIAQTAYYYSSIEWAIRNKLIEDVAKTNTYIQKECTREDFAYYLWLYKGKETVAIKTPFSDIADSPYDEAIKWAFLHDITNGTGKGKFSPTGTCTRAEIVTMLYRVGGEHVHTLSVNDTVMGDNPCTATTVRTSRCTTCSRTVIATFKGSGHQYELSQTIEPKNEKEGKNIYKCSTCGDTYETVIPATKVIIKNVPFIDQRQKWPTGCESVSAVMALQYMGYSIGVDTFIDNYLQRGKMVYSKSGKKYGADPDVAFVGNPRSASGGYGCFAPCIIKACEKYIGATGKVNDLTGMTLNEIAETYIRNGIPVLIWASTDMKPMYWRNRWIGLETGKTVEWYSPMHCLLLIGFDKDNYYFNDPQRGACVPYAKSNCEASYKIMRQQAVAITKNK